MRWTLDFEMDSQFFIITKPEGPKLIIGTMIYIFSLSSVRVDVATYPVWPTEFCRFFKGVRLFSRLTFSLTRPPVAHFFIFLIQNDCRQKTCINQPSTTLQFSALTLGALPLSGSVSSAAEDKMRSKTCLLYTSPSPRDA